MKAKMIMKYSVFCLIGFFICAVNAVPCYKSFDNILLIINYNHPHYESIPFIKELYGPYFANIVFYGTQKHSDVYDLPLYKGYFSYLSIADAMERFPDYEGYFFVHDDCIINPWRLLRLDRNKIWIPKTFWITDEASTDIGTPINVKNPHFPSWCWWGSEWGYWPTRIAFEELPDEAKQLLESSWGEDNVVGSYADVVYIPALFKERYIELARIFGKNKVFLEIALPTIIACLSSKEEYEFLIGQLWGYATEKDYNHPIKLSYPEKRAYIKEIFTTIGF
ncbi:MAG: hypothetical protein AB7E68_02635 [Candidatus Babeliales bacterium]